MLIKMIQFISTRWSCFQIINEPLGTLRTEAQLSVVHDLRKEGNRVCYASDRNKKEVVIVP